MRKHSQQQHNERRLPETLIAIGELAQAVAHEIGGIVGPVQFTVCRDLAAVVVREKRCPACGEMKPRDAFSKAGYCHPCNNRKGREYSRTNREICNAARRRRRQTNPDKARAEDKRQRELKRERDPKTFYAKQYERTKRWRAKHPEKVREILRRSYDRNRSPFGYELRQTMRLLEKLRREIVNAKEQDRGSSQPTV
ncbi:MAG: hypothetical protein KF831_06705 [Acidobacteria bacterium]|nr:hypothetical protein [Acidobacteriota bacterium]